MYEVQPNAEKIYVLLKTKPIVIRSLCNAKQLVTTHQIMIRSISMSW